MKGGPQSGSGGRSSCFSMLPRGRTSSGLTLIELLVCAMLMAIGVTALLGAYLGQITLNEHARNLAWAMNDVNRVMERLRQLNTSCGTTPTATAPSECGSGTSACASWDDWLASTTGGGKNIQPNPSVNELIVVTSSGSDPLQITVAACWRHRNRVVGECTWNGTQLTSSDLNGNGVIESPAMLSTLMTCRS